MIENAVLLRLDKEELLELTDDGKDELDCRLWQTILDQSVLIVDCCVVGVELVDLFTLVS